MAIGLAIGLAIGGADFRDGAGGSRIARGTRPLATLTALALVSVARVGALWWFCSAKR